MGVVTVFEEINNYTLLKREHGMFMIEQKKGRGESPKIKIFDMVYTLCGGGVERFNVCLLKYIDKDKIKIDFITKRNREEFFDGEVKRLGATKIVLSRFADTRGVKNKIQMAIKAVKTMREDYDVLYFNLTSPADALKYPLMGRIFANKKIIIHSHNSSDEKKGTLHRLSNRIGRLFINSSASLRLACSLEAARWMYGDKYNQKSNYHEINNGVDLCEFYPNSEIRKKVRTEIDVTDDTLVLGCVGRMTKQKNLEFALFVLAEVCKVRPNTVLIHIGTGELKQKLSDLVNDLELANNVLFLGMKTNVNDYLQAMDLYLMPSLFEGLPIAGIEAQASGVRCLFSDTISREVKVSDLVEFLPLDKTTWIDRISSAHIEEHINVSDQIIESGYDIRKTAKTWQLYIEGVIS